MSKSSFVRFVSLAAPAALLLACQSTPRTAESGQRAETTYTRGSSVTRSETTYVRGDTMSRRGGQTSGAVVLTLDRASYSPGARVAMTITSHSSETLGFNPCNRLLERQQGGSWTSFSEPGRMCTMELWLLEPHATRSANTDLPTSATAGTYRMVLLLSPQRGAQGTAAGRSDPVRAVSAPFQIQ